MKFLFLFLLTSIWFAATPALAPAPLSADDANPKIQVALLLDTSNSMDNLIDQAKSQLWKMVNELATSKQDGQSPDIEIALYEYGNDRLNGDEGFVRQVTPMTTDLDLVSDALFGLKTNGGSEYCGWVIDDAVDQLTWDANRDVLKIIFISGNEPFTQGRIDYRKSCKKAIENDIVINTIFCGSYETGVNGQWQDGAYLAEGKYFNIDLDAKVSHIPTPYDTSIMRLNSELNKTYIGFNRAGASRVALQSVQDDNAGAYSVANARQRASYKAKKQYNNASWDLVDAYKKDNEVLNEIEEEVLPDEWKSLSKDQIKTKIEQLTQQRKTIQDEIIKLEKQARKYEDKARAESTETNTLDNAMMKAIKEQATKKKFKF